MPVDNSTPEKVENSLGQTELNPKFYPDFSRKLVCIEYPGIVQNVDKALQTLGGMATVETVC